MAYGSTHEALKGPHLAFFRQQDELLRRYNFRNPVTIVECKIFTEILNVDGWRVIVRWSDGRGDIYEIARDASAFMLQEVGKTLREALIRRNWKPKPASAYHV